MQIKHLGLLLFMLAGVASAGDNNADNWTLISSNDGYWIKTVNTDQHELLVAYHETDPQFLLILKTDSPPPDRILPISISIDRGPKQQGHLRFLENRPEQSIFRIMVNEADKSSYISQMIAGLSMTVYFDFTSETGTRANAPVSRQTVFSLKGFTVALNDLLIANDIGSMDPAWLMNNNRDRELYCLITTDISIDAMQYRLRGKSYSEVLQLIPDTGYTVIDHNLGEIIEQVYKIPKENMAHVPGAEKYLVFTHCMEHLLDE